jgi:hypothetical protein
MKKILFFLFIGMLSAQTVTIIPMQKKKASGTVAPSAITRVDTNNIGVWTTTASVIKKAITLSSLSNGYMIVGVSSYQPQVKTTVTWKDVELDSIGYKQQFNNDVKLFGMKAPSTGADTIIVTFYSPTSGEGGVTLATYSNVNQTTPFGAFATAGDNSLDTARVDVSSATGELVVGVLSTYNVLASTSNTRVVYAINSLSSTSSYMVEQSGSATTRIEFRMTNGNPWALIGIPLKPL